MSVVSRVVLAGLICAAVGGAAVAAPPGDDANGNTRGRFFHASKCVVTLGFSGGCDKDTANAKRAEPADRAEVTKVSAETDNSTRSQFFRASKCVVSLGFAGNCDKDAPAGAPSASRRADAAPAEPDTSTSGRFKHASTCVISLGFAGNCDKK